MCKVILDVAIVDMIFMGLTWFQANAKPLIFSNYHYHFVPVYN